MSNKPSAKAIAKLNATTLFPEIKKEIVANPSLFAIRGFFIFNITKKGVPMTEWYILLQGFDSAPVVSQKRPEIPKVKKDEQPIPVAIFQIEDSDLLNFMSGGLTGPRGIVSGKIKIAGAIELAEQLEEIFRKAKGAEKTLAYLEHKRAKSEKARARLSNPAPTQSKVQSLARRYSAMAKQAANETSTAHQDKPKPIIGKVSSPLGKPKESPAETPTSGPTAAAAATVTPVVVAATAAAASATATSETLVEEEEEESSDSNAQEIQSNVDDHDNNSSSNMTHEQANEAEFTEEPESVQAEEIQKQQQQHEEEEVKAQEPTEPEVAVAVTDKVAEIKETKQTVEDEEEEPAVVEEKKEEKQESKPQEVTKTVESEIPANVESAVEETKVVEA
ncbi:hypothetical protein BG004_008149 [Podila humilis]|nr:hypothetical protein BG004_008149 [Podila humilis]